MSLVLLCSSPLQTVNSLRHIEKLLIWVWFCAMKSNVNSPFGGLNKGDGEGTLCPFSRMEMNQLPLPRPTVNGGGQEDMDAPRGVVLPKQALVKW